MSASLTFLVCLILSAVLCLSVCCPRLSVVSSVLLFVSHLVLSVMSVCLVGWLFVVSVCPVCCPCLVCIFALTFLSCTVYLFSPVCFLCLSFCTVCHLLALSVCLSVCLSVVCIVWYFYFVLSVGLSCLVCMSFLPCLSWVDSHQVRGAGSALTYNWKYI